MQAILSTNSNLLLLLLSGLEENDSFQNYLIVSTVLYICI